MNHSFMYLTTQKWLNCRFGYEDGVQLLIDGEIDSLLIDAHADLSFISDLKDKPIMIKSTDYFRSDCLTVIVQREDGTHFLKSLSNMVGNLLIECIVTFPKEQLSARTAYSTEKSSAVITGNTDYQKTFTSPGCGRIYLPLSGASCCAPGATGEHKSQLKSPGHSDRSHRIIILSRWYNEHSRCQGDACWYRRWCQRQLSIRDNTTIDRITTFTLPSHHRGHSPAAQSNKALLYALY